MLVAREIEYFFQFPNSTDMCGPYKDIEECKKDSSYGKWDLFWRYKAIPPSSYFAVTAHDRLTGKV